MWSPLLTSTSAILGAYYISHSLYVQLSCNTLELDQLRHLCPPSYGPGAPDDCEILPQCVVDEDYQYFFKLQLAALISTGVALWFLLRKLARRLG